MVSRSNLSAMRRHGAPPAGTRSLDADPDLDDSFLVGVAAAPSIDPELHTRLLPGAHVAGKYRIEARIGQGGMGTVYRATDTRLQRTVAIKIHHSLTTRVERLRREARLLARLSHPNVVTVLEVGTHEGMVFVAMEHVAGGNARTWLRERPRSWQEIVELYRQAGRGLAAAHALGIVHRDFKPDNVLVGAEPGAVPPYRARVADFGLAGRANDSEHGFDDTLELAGPPTSTVAPAFATEVGVMVGTPAYVAPEQIGSSRVDARADQFAFCVALFEAVYGSLPFPGATAQQVIARIALGEVVPPPVPGRAPTWLLGVLERGLAVEPRQRFPDMHALLAALVPARRARRWLPLAAVGVGIAWMGLTLSSREPATSGCEGEPADVAWRQRRVELGDAVRAEADPAALEAWTLLDVRLGERIDAWSATRLAACVDQGDGADLRLRERQLACLADVQTATDALLAELTEKTAGALTRASELTQHLPDPSRCVAAPVSTVAPPPAAIAADVDALRGELAVASTRVAMGRTVSGSALADVVAARAQQLGYGPLVSEALTLRARARSSSGRTEEAFADARAAYDEAERVEFDHGMSVAADLLAQLAFQNFDLDQALHWNDEARSHIDRPHEDAELIVVLVCREAEIRVARDEIDAGLSLLDRAEAFVDEAGLPDDIRALVDASRAGIAAERGDYGAAIAGYERAREGYERTHGPSSERSAMLWRNTGVAYHGAGNYLEARNAFERGLEIYERAGDTSPLVSIGLQLDIAAADDMLGDGERALLRYDEIEARMRASGLDNVHIERSIAQGRGVTLLGLSRGEEALVQLTRALELSERLLGAEHDGLRNTLANLSMAARQIGQYEEAEGYLRRALRIQSAREHVDDNTVSLLHGYGFLLIDLDRPREAADQFERAAELLARLGLEESAEMGWVEFGRGKVALARGEPGLAAGLLMRADALWPDGAVPPDARADLRFNLATARWQSGDRAGALAIARAAAVEAPGDPHLRHWLTTHRG